MKETKCQSLESTTNYTSTTHLFKEAKAQLVSLKFADLELARLQDNAITLQTARIAYVTALG
jgi:hypothetical protein